MDDLFAIMSKLKDSQDRILIPGISDDVAQISCEERRLLAAAAANIDLEAYKNEAGCKGFSHSAQTAEAILTSKWMLPSLTIHGIEGAHSGPGNKTVIPGKVLGKFSIRLVPNQEPAKVCTLVKQYLCEKWRELQSPNAFNVYMHHGGRPWVADYKHPNYQAAVRAVSAVYGQEPLMTREGGSIPITLTLQELTGKNVLLLPICQSDDGAHAQNEKMSVRNYISGVSCIGTAGCIFVYHLLYP